MHGLDESEDIRLSDTVRVTDGAHKGRIGIVEEIHREAVGHLLDTVRSRYVVVWKNDKMHYRAFDPRWTEETYEATDTKPPTLSRISSEEAAAMVATVTDTIG